VQGTARTVECKTSVTISFTECSRAVPVPGPSAKLWLPAVESNLSQKDQKVGPFWNFGISNFTVRKSWHVFEFFLPRACFPSAVRAQVEGQMSCLHVMLPYDPLRTCLIHAVSSFRFSTCSSMFFILSLCLTIHFDWFIAIPLAYWFIAIPLAYLCAMLGRRLFGSATLFGEILLRRFTSSDSGCSHQPCASDRGTAATPNAASMYMYPPANYDS